MNARSSQVRSGLGRPMPHTGNGTFIPISLKGMGLPALPCLKNTANMCSISMRISLDSAIALASYLVKLQCCHKLLAADQFGNQAAAPPVAFAG